MTFKVAQTGNGGGEGHFPISNPKRVKAISASPQFPRRFDIPAREPLSRTEL